MHFDTLAIADVLVLEPKRFGDDRGFFSETYNARTFADIVGDETVFVQDNQSLSVEPWVLRGLHFQKPPFAQAKLVRVVHGRIWDVAVDIREHSKSFGQWVAVELSAENWKQLYIPEGFAHGFLTLEPNTEVVYKVADFYKLEADCGIIWNDPTLSIDWPLPAGVNPVLSDKDRKLPGMSEARGAFS